MYAKVKWRACVYVNDVPACNAGNDRTGVITATVRCRLRTLTHLAHRVSSNDGNYWFVLDKMVFFEHAGKMTRSN